jgi:hypothetical protein
MSGKLKIKGNIMLTQKLQTLFNDVKAKMWLMNTNNSKIDSINLFCDIYQIMGLSVDVVFTITFLLHRCASIDHSNCFLDRQQITLFIVNEFLTYFN